MKRVISLLLLSICLTSTAFSQKRAINVEDLWALGRIGHFVLSPDGQWIAYTVTLYDLAKNSENTDIYLVNSLGGHARQLTTHPAYDGNPCWSPDGSLLAFISAREGKPQIYEIPMDGGEAIKMSAIPTGVDDFKWSPDGKYFAFTTRVYPYVNSLDSSAMIDQQLKSRETKARIIDHLFYRHWDRWIDKKRRHVYVMPTAGGSPWDVTPGNYNTPTITLGSRSDYCFSPDGEEIAFVRNIDVNTANSINNDIFVVPTKGGSIRRITQNLANDNLPVYSPDGRYIAYRAMRRPGFEADQYDLMLFDRDSGEKRNLTGEFNLSVEEITWAPSSEKIYFECDDCQGRVVFSVEIREKGKTKGLVHDGCNSNIVIGPDEENIYFLRTYIDLPHEIYCCDIEGEGCFQITFTNEMLLDQIEMNGIEDFYFPSFDGALVHGMLLKPPFFDPAETYPAILLIHGGPQGAWKNEFHYRWNAQMFASRGYVVIMFNIRGSVGYGKEYVSAVTKNWGGGPYKDLMVGIDYVLKKFKYVQPKNIVAAGGSYGGFMVNWIAGHTDRFKCLVSHAGIFDLVSFYGATEELWFPEWEFEGTPYENMRQYERWNPVLHAKHFKTPTLVIHGEKDYRVPVEQGLQMFTALQRQNVPSKLVLFPDEGHLILKPQNARLWWNTVLGWIEHWIRE